MGDIRSRIPIPPIHPLQGMYRAFCRMVTRVFYRRCEVFGLERLPRTGAVVLCGNHPNALVDAVILQAVSPRLLHPLARSGLFKNPLLRPLLAIMQAVPIYRRQDQPPASGAETSGAETSGAASSGAASSGAATGGEATKPATGKNLDAFQRCYDFLATGEVLLIFPEGESHSDSQLRTFKTGAARIALGALARDGSAPLVLPVGLNFSEVGRFRSSVFVNFGEPVPVESTPDESTPGEPEEEAVIRLTGRIQTGLEAVTLNPESWRDLDLLRRLERFFALRRNRIRQRTMGQRFRTLKKLNETHLRLWREHPGQVERVRLLLNHFERLCRKTGVKDYHLTLNYTPMVVARFVARTLSVLLVMVPVALWGALNCALPYWLTGWLAARLARGRYQYDTARITLGMLFFGGFWGGQTAWVWQAAGGWAALGYVLSLPVAGAVALFVSRERTRIQENIRVFFVFLRKKELREYMREKRRHLEVELAKLAQAAKRSRTQN